MRIHFEDGSLLADRVVEARSFTQRGKGLLGRASLEEGEGMYFADCASIHMFFMRMALDVVFLDADHRVIKVRRNLLPWQIAVGGGRSKHTLELAAGSLEDGRPAIGEQLRLGP